MIDGLLSWRVAKSVPKSGVGGNHNALLMLSANEDLLVGGGLHVVIADMRGIVPSFLQPRGENR